MRTTRESAALYLDFTLDGMIIAMHRMFTLGSILSLPVGSTDGNLYALR